MSGEDRVESKSLGHADTSGFELTQEALCGDRIRGINIDSQYLDCQDNRYVLIELLNCNEEQKEKGINPWTSHPNKYYTQNRGKWIMLENYRRDLQKKGGLPTRLFLVNYANKGSEYEDRIKVMEVVGWAGGNEPVKTETISGISSRAHFSQWLRQLNARGSGDIDKLVEKLEETPETILNK